MMFDNTFYKQIIDSSPIGYAYHKILCDEKGVPHDYQYIEANPAFEKLTGLNRKYIIGKTIAKVLPGILKSEFDWIACYGEVALNGTEKTFEQYSEPLKKWYRVNTFSPKKGYFATTFVDITNEKEQIEDLSKVLETSDDYLDGKNIINYQKITDTMMELSEAKVASFNIYDENGDTYRTVAISADSTIIRKGTEILGINLEGKVWNHDPVRAEKIKNQIITRFNKLSDLVGDVIPSAVVDLLVKSLGLGETVLVKITKDDRMIGDFTLIMKNGKTFDKDEICEIYAKQLGLAIEIERSERNLSSSRQEYMSLVENAPGVVYRCLNNENWTMLMMSNEIEEITSYHSDDFIRDQEKTFTSIIYPEDVNSVSTEIQKAITADKPWSINYRIVHKDGHIRWVHENGRGIKNEHGDIVYLDGIILDVTKQKETEEKLRNSEELSRTVVNQAPVGLFRFLMSPEKDMKFTYMSHNVNNIFGVSAEEIIDDYLKLHEKVNPLYRERVSKAIEKSAVTLKPFQEDILIDLGENKDIWVQVRSTPEKHEDGSILWTGVFIDIDQQKRATESLEHERIRLKSIIDGTNSGTWECNLVTGETIINENWANVLGYDLHELMPANINVWISNIHPDDKESAHKILEEHIRGERDYYEQETRMKHKKGHYVWVFGKGKIISWTKEGQPEWMYGTHVDITDRKKAELAVLEEERNKKILLDNIPTQIWYLTDETTYGTLNKTHADFNGVAVQDFAFKSMYTIFPEEVVDVCRKSNEQVFQKKETVVTEEWVPHVSGDMRLLSITKTPKITEDGRVEYVVCAAEDITQRKQSEEELKRSKQELDTYFTSSLDLLCIANTKGEFIRLNPEWEKVLGFSIKELEGQSFLDFVHPDDLKATLEAIKDLESQKEVTSFTNRYRCKDGTYRWIEWRSKPIDQMIYAVARDITAHIKLQESLSNRERQYRLLAENVADVVWTTDLELNTTWISPSIYQLTGETPEEYLTTKIQDRFSQKDFMKLNHLFQQQLLLEEDSKADKKRSVDIELQHRKKDGNSIWVSMKMTFLRDEHGRPIGIHGVTRDISERVEKDQAIQKQNNQQQMLLSASEKLINAVSDNLNNVIEDALSQVGKISEADRVYLFEHDYHLKVTNNIYEWCGEGIVPQIEILKNVPFSEVEEWLYYHGKGESIVINDVQALPEGDSVREILEPQGIKSLLSVPVFFEGELFGFIGFDSVRKHHFYTKEEQAFLHQFASNLVMTIKKNDYTEELKNSERYLQIEKEQFKTTLLSVGDGIISTDEEGKVLILNPIAEQLTGWTQEEAIGKPIEEVFYIVNEYTRQRCENPVQKVLATGDIIELANHTMLISRDGIERPIEDSAAPIRDENSMITGVVLVFRDFTEKKKSQDEIKYLSLHDHLTGLYNRRFFEVEMERLDTERNLPITIIMGDVNGLKLINDSFGHSVGDELLIKGTKSIKNCLRTDDILARVGGDEVAILLPKTAKSEAKALVKRIKAELKEEKIKDIDVSVSFGWETKTKSAESLALVLKKAEDSMYNDKLFEGPSIRGKAIENIISTINEKSPREKAHSERVSKLCVAIGSALDMDEKELNHLKVLGLFHDIGKIAVPDDILNKPSKLTDREYKEICRHAEIGYRILSAANGMTEMAEFVLYHHERWDGKGYPKGLSGEAIPLYSRICTLADACDAMTSDRSYRPAMTNEFAVEELKKNSGKQFDPELVKVFIEKVLPELMKEE